MAIMDLQWDWRGMIPLPFATLDPPKYAVNRPLTRSKEAALQGRFGCSVATQTTGDSHGRRLSAKLGPAAGLGSVL